MVLKNGGPVLPENEMTMDVTRLVMILLGGTGLYATFVAHFEVHHPIQHALLAVLYLMAVIGSKRFWLPKTRSELAPVPAGFLSMFSDSFVVVKAYYTIMKRSEGKVTDTEMKVLVKITLSALIVGFAFLIGEIYGIPYYESHGVSPWGGFVFLLTMAPILIWMWFQIRTFANGHPLESEKPIDIRNSIELVAFIAVLILTNNPILSLSAFLLYESIAWGRNGARYVLNNLIEEIVQHSGWIGLGLLMAAIVIEPTALGERIAHARGLELTFWAAVSSPLAGSLVRVETLAEWIYQGGYLVAGAILLPTSSLVGVMVLPNTKKVWVEYIKNSVPYAIVWLAIHEVLFRIGVYEVLADVLKVAFSVATGNSH